MGLLAGCGSEKSKMTQEAGVLRVGSETTFPPFEFTEGDKYVGFDVDLSEAIAKKLGDFSDVYFDQGGFITVVRKDNSTIHNMDELAGKTVGVQIGTVPVDMAKAIPNTTVKEMDSNANIFMELKAGTIDAAIIDNAVAMYYLKQGADKDLKLVGEPTKAPGTVLGVKKGNKELQDAVNKALKELKEDGTYQKIYDKYCITKNYF
ncbi:MAG: transporter substrate-binding domain-containing protein [Veillonella sp.]|nr:transporter substrate-binding domain-containing protein [Veillonella sp.]